MESEGTNNRPPRVSGEVRPLQEALESPEAFLRLLGPGRIPSGVFAAKNEDARLLDEDVMTFIRLLSHLALASRQVRSDVEAAELAEFFQQRLQSLPEEFRAVLEEALNRHPDRAGATSEAPLAMSLAAYLVQRMAAAAYRRGELDAEGLHTFLQQMEEETRALRRALDLPQGREAESEEVFWTGVSPSDRRRLLESEQAWCLPPVLLAGEVTRRREETDTARRWLRRYAACAGDSREPARRRAAAALEELAGLYGAFGEYLLVEALEEAAAGLKRETLPELEERFARAFAALARQAADRRLYGALERAEELLQGLEREQPARGEVARGRVRVEDRLGEFVREAASSPAVPAELLRLLQRRLGESTEALCVAFEASCERRERDRLAGLAAALGPRSVNYLRDRLLREPPPQAVKVVGLLSRLDPDTLRGLLPGLLKGWTRIDHDAVVQALAAAGAGSRGHLLVGLLDWLDPLALPGALDEVGLSGEREAAPRVMRLAAGLLPQSSEPYLRLKAVEAVGRLGEPAAVPLLRQLVEAKGVWRWKEPRELRLAAAQALVKLDPGWGRKVVEKAGLSRVEFAVGPLASDPESPWVRQRRYPRIPVRGTLTGLASTLRGDWPLVARVLSLGGGLAWSQKGAPPGTRMKLMLQAGLRPVRATAVVRAGQPPWLGFEIVGIELRERAKLRRLLLPHGSRQAAVPA